MKTLINKNNPQIRTTAPEIGTGTHGYYYVGNVGYHKDKWTLVEDEPTIVKTIKEFVEKGKRCEQQAVEDNDQENYIFWGGFRNCAENILREVEKPTEGIKGKKEEIPSMDLEKEIYKWLHSIAGYNNVQIPVTFDDIENTARHFYELGKRNKEE